MGKIDFLLDKVQRHLDELRMEYKKNGISRITQEFENFQDSHDILSDELNTQLEDN